MRSRVGASALLFILLSAAVLAAPKRVILNLEWQPVPKTERRPPSINATGGLYRVRFAPLVDSRERGRLKPSSYFDQVGENTEGPSKVPVLSPSDVAPFVDQQVVRELKLLGFDLTADDAPRVVTWQLTDLWVTENHGYEGTVRCRVTVSDREGKELWTGIVSGRGENSGRSFRPINYVETISNTILNFVDSLGGQQGFQAALRKAGSDF